MSDVSIDLETLGTTPDCQIISIGAVEFNIETGELSREIYLPILLTNELDGRINGGTIKWWMEQSDIARRVFNDPNAKLLESQLDIFANYIESIPSARVWGNGATFDISILEHAYRYNPPWAFYNVQDMRTIMRVAECITDFRKKDVVRDGVHHNAVDDAIFQAKCIHQAYNALRG